MLETIEIRFTKRHAPLILHENEGELLMNLVRRVKWPATESRIDRVGPLSKQLRAAGETLYTYWRIRRRYSSSELSAGELFQLWPATLVEPAGEECGTTYDYSGACPVCGAGRESVSALHLAPGSLPKVRDIAMSIARDEIVISERAATVMQSANITGAALKPVLECRGERPIGPRGWYQLAVTSAPIGVHALTMAGATPFGDESEGTPACPVGDTIGLNLLSELFVRADSWDRSDVCLTDRYVGRRSGLIVPRRMLVVSARLRKLFTEHGIKGCEYEIAHLR